MARTLRQLSEELEHCPPASDDALDLVVEGWHQRGRPACLAYEHLAGVVLEVWAERIAWHLVDAGCDRSGPVFAEAHSQASEWLIEQLAGFRPNSQGKGAGAYIESTKFQLKSSTRSIEAGISPAGYRVRSAAKAVRERLGRELEREPSIEELTEATREQLRGQLRPGLRKEHPTDSPAELEVRVERRMSKDSLNTGLNQLESLLEGEPLSVDEACEVGPPPLALRHYDPDAAPELLLERLWRLALGDAVWARQALDARLLGGNGEFGGIETATDGGRSWRALSEELGHSVREVKRVVSSAQSRVAAPHAQWSHTGGPVSITGRH